MTAPPGPPSAPPVDLLQTASVLRRLELEVDRRLDGLITGDYLAWSMGPGTERTGARRYEPSDDARRIDYALLLCVSRPARPAERDTLLALLQSHRRRLAEGWLNPREVTTGDPAKLPALPDGATPQDAAAWTLVARVLLNLDETISKN